MLHRLEKFNEKLCGKVSERVRLTILELRPNFAQKWGSQLSKLVLAQFWRRIRLRDLKITQKHNFVQIDRIR